jgi:hypothetical protein
MQFLTTRTARNTSAAVVAGIAGYVSYWHQAEVAKLAGERDEIAHLLPLSVDGLLIVASVAMVDARAEGRKPSWKTKVGFAVGIAASIGANVMSAQPTWLGRIVAAWPALALLLVVEILASKGRRIREAAAKAEAAEPAPEPAPVPVPQAPPAVPIFSAAPTSPAPMRNFTRPRDGQLVSPLTGKALQLNGKHPAHATVGGEDDE